MSCGLSLICNARLRLTYSINFAAMIVAAAGQIEIWTKTKQENHGKAIQGTIIFFVVPLFLVLFNSFGVQVSFSLGVSTGNALTIRRYMD